MRLVAKALAPDGVEQTTKKGLSIKGFSLFVAY